ncbi:AAA family ATPase [Microbispora bryophytorum]|uniref:AAA family ATPase n=1 Tax=Microbispora bryophytorum TaxID=1460882 RepID=UPI0033ED3712
MSDEELLTLIESRMTRCTDCGSPEHLRCSPQQAQRGDVAQASPAQVLGPDLFTSGAAFVLDVPAEVPSIWGKGTSVLWAPGEAIMIVGGNGVGKTTLAHQLVAARLGILDTVLGFSVEAGSGRVLYLACDRPRQIARAMQRLFSEEHREILEERLIVWKGPPPHDFAKRTDILVAMCAKAEADTVVVDSLKDVAIGLSEDAVGAAYNRARQQAIAAGVEVIELHHQKKVGNSGGKPNELGDVYGSTWITAGAGSVILLDGKAGDPIVDFKHLKQPADEVGPFRVVHDHDTGLSSIEGSVDLLTLSRNFPHGMTPKAAAMQLFDTDEPTRSETEKARRKLDKLVSDGLMVVKEGAHTGPGKPPRLYFRVALREVPA